MIDSILELVGTIPPGYEWIVGIMAIVLFSFICHVAFELIATFFGFFRGGDKHGRSY